MGEGDRLGQQIGNYHLENLLGSGGFAEVYLGRHIYLDSHAAIKLLRTNLEQEEIEAFRTEARTLVHLIHPHIVRLLDFGLQGNTPFLVMDYASNGTLRQRLQPGEKFPLATVVEYVKQVASALQYAHDEKIIHRDVKPGNMLLGRQNEVLLSDFGIAVVAHSTHTALTQEMTGTVAYMAPEQIEAHPRPASDQYSLGVVVYEWLSGYPPFRGPFTEIAVKHLTTAPPSLRDQIPDLAPEVEQIVFTALAKDPAKRFGSVRAFANALEQASKSARIALPESVQQKTLLAPTIPALPAEVSSPVRVAASSPEGPQAIAPTIGASPYPITPSPEMQAVMPFVPRVPSPGPLTPPPFPPVQRAPETQDHGLPRRAVLIAGLSVLGVAAAGGIAWELVSHSTSHASPQTTSHTQTVKIVTSSPTRQTPTPIPGLLAQDTFSRPNQSFWGTATDGLAWGGDANKLTDFAISGGMGQISRTASGKSLYTAVLGTTAHVDAEVKATASVDQFNPSHIGVMLRYTDDNNYYKTFFDGNNLNMIRRLGGHNTTLQSIPFPAQANTLYTIRFQVVGTTLNARVWQTHQNEPATWMLTATDNTFQSGLGGFRPQVNQGVTFRASLFQETMPTTS